jgi:hypothetical protein
MTPTERILNALESHGSELRQSSKGWLANCPAHDDSSPSLSISAGDDGRALVKCFAGCSSDAVCSALGLKLADLMPPNCNLRPVSNVNVNGIPKTPGKTAILLTANGKSTGKVFPTAREAVADLERHRGPRSALWTYNDAAGEPVGVVARWNLPDGKKDIRPASRNGAGWRLGGMTEPRPLYCLPDLASATRVYVCEGEKAADAVRAIGLTATTSAHGAQSAAKTDWGPLAGKEVVILPDNDPPGRKYADAVAGLLAKLTPAPVVKLVELPDLPDGGDAADFVEAREGTDIGALRRIVEGLADEAEPLESTPTGSIERRKPFPTDALPEPLCGFVAAGAKAISCDPSYIALPLLVTLAAAIGNTRRVRLKRGWTAPAILWGAIVGESGTAKSPAFKLVMRSVRDRQRKALDRHTEAMRGYQSELLHHEKSLTEWKKKRSADDPPEKPEAPKAERFVVSDTTVEALAAILLENPRGLLLARDELSGWVGSFDRYSGGKGGADAAHWLSMHGGESIVVDRKAGVPRTIFVPSASVSVVGGIQPAILHRALGVEHRESGLAARLLLTCPPRVPKRWTESDIDPAAEAELAKLIETLYELQPTEGDDGEPTPVVVKLSPDAKAVWKTYYNAHAEEQADLVGELSAAWSKLEEYAARLALVLHCARWAAGDQTLDRDDVVDEASMAAGIRLATWFKAEARRVYARLGETEADGAQRQLIEWVERKGGTVTARDVQMGCRWLREPGAAEAAIEGLAKADFGNWELTPSGRCGQPTRHFRLSTVNSISQIPGENSNTVDVDTVDAPKIDWDSINAKLAEVDSDDDWGTI